eukprot:g6459.t1
MKILQILILFTIINVIIGITNSEQTFGSKTNKLVSNKPRQAVAKEKNVEDDVPATDAIPDKYLKHSVSVFKDTFEDSKVTKKVWKMPDLGKEASDMIGIEMMPGKEPMADGAACPNLNETAKCNQFKCAIMGVPHIQRSGKPLVKAPWDTLMTRNNSNWCYQIEKAIAPYHYGYLPECTKVVKEDIDAMQKALNEKLATRAKLAQEEMENTRSEMNTKRREETMKYDEAKNKILDAQQNLVKQQDTKRIETERESKSAQDEAKQFEAEKKLANDRQKKMENEKESAAKESVAGLQQINAAKAENEMRAARALQVDQKAELADSESKKAAEAGIKLAALKEQQKATEGEEQSSLQNGKAVANDAKVSQIMQETKNRLAQESARN